MEKLSDNERKELYLKKIEELTKLIFKDELVIVADQTGENNKTVVHAE